MCTYSDLPNRSWNITESYRTLQICMTCILVCHGLSNAHMLSCGSNLFTCFCFTIVSGRSSFVKIDSVKKKSYAYFRLMEKAALIAERLIAWVVSMH